MIELARYFETLMGEKCYPALSPRGSRPISSSPGSGALRTDVGHDGPGCWEQGRPLRYLCPRWNL